MSETLIWIGIALCLLHSGMFSGLNLALMGISRLQLEVEAQAGNPGAARVLALRADANFLLATILWGNVAVNVLLTLLSDSILTGVVAFLFSTFGITLLGEILPQAYFSRNSLMLGARLAPVVQFYQRLLYPVAKPSARLLDWILGPEGLSFLRERDLRELIKRHIQAEESDVAHHEGTGALNFLALDDLPVGEEGELVDPRSVIALPVTIDLPQLPAFEPVPQDPFVQQVLASGKKWVILTDLEGKPRLAMDADGFLRALFSGDAPPNPYAFCHRPILVTRADEKLGALLPRLEVRPERSDDDVIDRDIILLWGEQRRVITGSDLLGRLMRGVARRAPNAPLPDREAPGDAGTPGA